MNDESGHDELGGGTDFESGSTAYPPAPPEPTTSYEQTATLTPPDAGSAVEPEYSGAPMEPSSVQEAAMAEQLMQEEAAVEAEAAQVYGDPTLADSGSATAEQPASQEQIYEQEQQLAEYDPALAAEVVAQEAQAEREAQQNPSEEAQISAQFEQTAIQEIGAVDPQLAQELAAEAQATPHASTTTHQVEPQHTTPPVAVPSAQVIEHQVQQLAQQDPSLANEIRGQEAQAQQAAEKDPQQAAQIDEKLEQTENREIGQVDPRLAQELSAQAQQANVTFDAQGDPTQGVAPTDHVIGDPTQDASQWTYQGANGYCGPNSISMLIEAATGHRITEQQIADYAIQHGEMTRLPSADDPSSIPSIHYGMLPQQAANAVNALAQQYGISAEIKTGNMGDLENYLKQGREVMIELDDQRIWHQQGVSDSDSANHYVVVTGFDPSTNTVFINDPGVPDGKAESIPLSEFESAWSTSNDVMIVTDPSNSSGGGVDEATDARPGPVLLPIVMDGSLARFS